MSNYIAQSKSPIDRFKSYLNGFSPPKNAIELLTIEIDVEKQEKIGLTLLKDLVIKVRPDTISHGKVKVGDLIMSVNGHTEDVKMAFVNISKSGVKGVKVEIARLCTRFRLPATALKNLGIALQEGYDYALNVLYFFRDIPTNLDVVHIEGRVYVGSVEVDSSSSLALGQGDCILSIEDTKLTTTQQLHDLLKEHSAKSCFVRLICEMPNCDMMKNCVRSKIQHAAPDPPIDLPLPADVREILRVKRETDAKTPQKKAVPILKTKKGKEAEAVQPAQTVDSKNKAKNIRFHEETRVQLFPIDNDIKLLVKPLPPKNANEAQQSVKSSETPPK
ncbi:unnamed protein product, partial [Mesorhabditis belari]|uniref:PDZ domain-containing protein n=1 Tax=Mesorhabditis belari TaxID=2138241 RepID=A0AAF3F6Y6_9BILA